MREVKEKQHQTDKIREERVTQKEVSEIKRGKEICHRPAAEGCSCSLSAMLKSFSHSTEHLCCMNSFE